MSRMTWLKLGDTLPELHEADLVAMCLEDEFAWKEIRTPCKTIYERYIFVYIRWLRENSEFTVTVRQTYDGGVTPYVYRTTDEVVLKYNEVMAAWKDMYGFK